MQKIKKMSLLDLSKTLIGHKVRFISDCEFFPNFIVSGRVLDVSIGNNNEYLINIKTKPTGKEMTVGSNMRNLSIIKG